MFSMIFSNSGQWFTLSKELEASMKHNIERSQVGNIQQFLSAYTQVGRVMWFKTKLIIRCFEYRLAMSLYS